jgi:hypothetical protein
MKKALFAAFAGLCIVVSVMSTSVNAGKTYGYQKTDRFIIRDTIPQPDTTRNPKRDTTRRPYLMEEKK